MDRAQLIRYLQQQGMVSHGAVEITPLSGGVSSDIVLVTNENQQFVIKQSLEKLKVEDDWYCDTSRNITEYQAIRYAARLFPQSVPRLLHGDPDNRLFVMEYLGEGFEPWKQQLLAGRIDLPVGEKVARLLATLHKETWADDEVKELFETTDNFFALRIEPYLLTAGERNPALGEILAAEAQRLRHARLALVHGDWSAKNMLVSDDRIVVLDWEVAWFGDPAFDSAFLLNLFYLKSLFDPGRLDEYLALIGTFRCTYRSELAQWDAAMERRICRLTQMLMLARIDGKSPAEYITGDQEKALVRQFIHSTLLENVDDFDALDERWQKVVAIK